MNGLIRCAYAMVIAMLLAAATISAYMATTVAIRVGALPPTLAWLAPVFLDGGALTGTIVWFARRTAGLGTRFEVSVQILLLLLSSTIAATHAEHPFPHEATLIDVSGIVISVLGAKLLLRLLEVTRAERARTEASARADEVRADRLRAQEVRKAQRKQTAQVREEQDAPGAQSEVREIPVRAAQSQVTKAAALPVVREMLDANPDLTWREIAERFGKHRKTATTWLEEARTTSDATPEQRNEIEVAS